MIRACLFALAAATSLFSASSVWAQAQQIPSFTIIQNQDRTLAKLIAEDLGVEARFRSVAAGESVDADLRFHVWKGPLVEGEVVNVMMHVPYNRELDIRNEQIVLTGQYMRESTAIAYSREVYPDDKPIPAYFRFDTVGVENDSLADFYLSSLAGGQIVPNMRRYPTPADAMKALAAGEVGYALDDAISAAINDGRLEAIFENYGLTYQPPER